MYYVTPDVQALVQGAIAPKGAAGALIASWERRETALVLCEEIVAEYEAVLSRPHIANKFAYISPATISASAAALREQSIFVTVKEVPRVVPDDPDDDVVLACAVVGHAEYIVSRDNHLLKMGAYQGIPIISAESFARILRGQVSEPLELVYGRPR